MAENQKTLTYKEKRGRSLFVPGYGVSDNNGILTTTNQTPLENPNFELVIAAPAPVAAPPEPAPTPPSTPPAPVANPQPQTKE